MQPWIWAAIALAVLVVCVRFRASRRRVPAPVAVEQPAVKPVPAYVPATTGAVSISRPNAASVEGLEITYGENGLVRSVRVGAMNSEHKELLLTMDEVAWRALPNSQKQEVLTVARSTWAKKMCPSGPDIAYVVLQTERGEIVGRADPQRVQIQ